MNVLVISPRIPFPPIGGAHLRTLHLLRALASRHNVTLLGFEYGDPHDRPPFELDVVAIPWEWPPAYRAMRGGDPAEVERALAQLAAPDAEPWFVSCVASTALERAIDEVVCRGVDVVVVEETSMGRFVPLLPSDCPVVLDLHNVHARIAGRGVETGSGDAGEAARTLRFERGLAARCSAACVVSEVEAAAARALLGADRVHVVPNGVDTASFAPASSAPDSARALFVGRMDYEPNIEAVRYFAREVWPSVRRRVPDATFHIVGTDPASEVRELADDDIVVHGRVPDVRPYYETASVVVVPLLAGGGTRLKLLEAAASGKAIVTTTVGMEGIELDPGVHLAVADEARGFADATVEFLTDVHLRERVGAMARAASLAYEWDSIGRDFCEVVEQATRDEAGSLTPGAA
jgi:glycosyltransferase involved in cell wall biosynthesis